MAARRSALATSWRLRARIGEDAAAAHVTSLGYRVLERNLRRGHDEADLVALTPLGAVAVIEVKARLGGPHGEERVDGVKRRNLLRLAAALVEEPRFAGRMFQFDVVAVALREDGGVEAVRHFPHAFDASGTEW
jgi:putative endonuclease